MRVEWNRAKAARNLLKHRVEFAEVVIALEDERALTIEDRFSNEEQRFITVGMDGLGRVLTVVYTYREQVCRLISARKASHSERTAYEKGIRFQ
jgi:uncharacterized DUF497 family protein